MVLRRPQFTCTKLLQEPSNDLYLDAGDGHVMVSEQAPSRVVFFNDTLVKIWLASVAFRFNLNVVEKTKKKMSHFQPNFFVVYVPLHEAFGCFNNCKCLNRLLNRFVNGSTTFFIYFSMSWAFNFVFNQFFRVETIFQFYGVLVLGSLQSIFGGPLHIFDGDIKKTIFFASGPLKIF